MGTLFLLPALLPLRVTVQTGEPFFLKCGLAADAAEAMTSSADSASASTTHTRFIVLDSFRKSSCASLEASVLEGCSAPPEGVRPGVVGLSGDLPSQQLAIGHPQRLRWVHPGPESEPFS